MLGEGGPRSRAGRPIWVKAVLVLLLASTLIVLLYYQATLTNINQALKQSGRNGPVSLRNLPYPYQAALGLTLSPGPGLTQDQYLSSLRHLVASPAADEPGLGLEAGGGIFFYPPSEEWMAYFNPPGPEGDQARMSYNSLIRAGIIDVLESYGQDVRFTREMAAHALKALTDQGLTMTTWADRFKSPDNIDSLGGRGSHSNRMAYHLDLTVKAGFKYFWLGRESSIMGQDIILDGDAFLSLYDGREMLGSSLGTLLTFGRHLALALAWPAEDAVRNNSLLAPVKLRDGAMGYEYIRYQPFGADRSLRSVLSEKFLSRLLETGGRSIIDITLKPDQEAGDVFSQDDLDVLAHVAEENRRGKLLVTTATRLLDLTALERNLVWRTQTEADRVKIIIEQINDPLTGPREPRLEELAGMTFYVPDSSKAALYVNNRELKLKRNLIDFTGAESISLPWPYLEFPDLTDKGD